MSTLQQAETETETDRGREPERERERERERARESARERERARESERGRSGEEALRRRGRAGDVDVCTVAQVPQRHKRQRHRQTDAETQTLRGTETQSHRGTETQRHRDTETQRQTHRLGTLTRALWLGLHGTDRVLHADGCKHGSLCPRFRAHGLQPALPPHQPRGQQTLPQRHPLPVVIAKKKTIFPPPLRSSIANISTRHRCTDSGYAATEHGVKRRRHSHGHARTAPISLHASGTKIPYGAICLRARYAMLKYHMMLCDV
eukprot:774047-Rhodomonas_salina.1